MRKWGIVITLLYALMVVGLILPGAILLAGETRPSALLFYNNILDTYKDAWAWVPIASLLLGEAALLALSVDTSHRQLKPKTHILISVIATSMLFGLLTFAAIFSLGVTIYSDKFFDRIPDTAILLFGLWALVWVAWGILFRQWFNDSRNVASRAVSWLLKGSVLELLVAVPCHVIVRRRHDCSAPVATGFGIATGIAVMLLAFGPGVLLLYKKRLDADMARKAALKAEKDRLVVF
jgi:hypothetical protein